MLITVSPSTRHWFNSIFCFCLCSLNAVHWVVSGLFLYCTSVPRLIYLFMSSFLHPMILFYLIYCSLCQHALIFFFLFHSQDRHCVDISVSLAPVLWLFFLLSEIVSLKTNCASREKSHWQAEKKTRRGERGDWQEKKMEKSPLTGRRMWRRGMEWEGKCEK